jgi:hypothetical protein
VLLVSDGPGPVARKNVEIKILTEEVWHASYVSPYMEVAMCVVLGWFLARGEQSLREPSLPKMAAMACSVSD